MPRSVSLSVIIPCFNESQVIRETHRRVAAVCRDCVENAFEILFIDDGSGDDTWAIIADLSRRDPTVSGVRLARNFGHQFALTAGLDLCTGENVLVIDADLQDPPELLPEMLRLMADSGADVVYGKRRRRDDESRFKRTTAALFYRLLNRIAEVHMPVDAGDFRLMSHRVVEQLRRMPEQQRYIRGMVSWLGFRQIPIEYDRQGRFAGSTKYPLRKMIRFALDGFTSFSIVPLRFASTLGITFGVLGLAGLAYALGSWWLGTVVSGWTSIILAILLLGGVQLLVVGILGEYIGRIYLESKRRPLYVIEQTTRSTHATDRDVPGGSAA